MKRLVRIAAVLALPLLLVACGNDDDNGDTNTNGETGEPDVLQSVTMMLDWTPNTNHLGIYVAQAEGYYAEEGLQVEIVEPGAGGVPQVVAQGAADFGISVQEAVIPAREQDVPVVSIAAIVEQNTSSLMALAESGIERPADLAGHAYGGFGGALERELIRTLVQCDGGDPDDVEFTEVGDVDYLVGMERGHYDFVWIFDGWDGIRASEIEGTDVSFIHFREHLDCIPNWYTPLIITSNNLIDNDPEVVEAFLAATSRGYEFAMANPAEAADILLEAVPELDGELVHASAVFLAQYYVTDEGNRWGEQEAEVWERFEAFLRQAELTEEEIEIGEAYTNEFLPEASGGSVAN